MAGIESEDTVSTELVFEGKLISVRRDTVRLPNGKTTEREIVEHAPTIAVLPVLDDGRIVMVRQFRKAAEREMLELPAGGIDGEESPADAVRREMKEETGYDVGDLTFLCSFFTSPGFTTEFMHLYRATNLTPGTPTESTDQIEIELLSPEDLRARMRSGEIVDAKTILGLSFGLEGDDRPGK
jgi:ADP-ribose pyrophosphatase